MLCNKRTDTDMQVCEQTFRTHDRARTHTHTQEHRNTAGGRGSGCQGGGRWVGTKQTTLRAGSPYRKVGLEKGSVFGVWVCVWAHEHVRRRCRCNTKGPADFEKPQQSGVDLFFFFAALYPYQKQHVSFIGRTLVKGNIWFLSAPLTAPGL